MFDENDGEISVDSREDEWTEFRVALPAATYGETAAPTSANVTA